MTGAQMILVDGVLVGSVVGYGGVISGNSPAPPGWLFCDGSEVSRDTYAGLFLAIGTMHGSGDGFGTFNLPDYRGRFHRGVDDGTGRDPDAAGRTAANPGGATGDLVGSVQAKATAQAAANKFGTTNPGDHTHTVSHVPVDKSRPKMSGSHYAEWNSGRANTGTSPDHQHSFAGGDADTCPINVYVNYLIFYGATS